jgi:hypothetical protein
LKGQTPSVAWVRISVALVAGHPEQKAAGAGAACASVASAVGVSAVAASAVAVSMASVAAVSGADVYQAECSNQEIDPIGF